MTAVMTPSISSYGSWKSPISAELVASAEVGLEQIRIDGDDLYWIERRPQEGGRKVIVRRSRDGKIAGVTPAGWNARTRVHEYGGGDYAVAGGQVVFANFSDQRLYFQRDGSAPRALTADGAMRYGDGQIDARRNLLFCVCEDHTRPGEPLNALLRIALADGACAVIESGNDFYSSPRLSPDGSRLAWLTWNHPNMPWDGTELWVGELDRAGSIIKKERVAGAAEESIVQPEWSPDGRLYFVSDRSGWWNLYRWQDNHAEPLYTVEAEFAHPHWVFAASHYAFVSARQIVCSYVGGGRDHLAILDCESKRLDAIDLPFTAISQVRVNGKRAIFIGASELESSSVVALDLMTRSFEVVQRSRTTPIDIGYISTAQAIEFPTEGNSTAHGYFYAPHNRDYSARGGDKPPLVVMSHGGPTSAASSSLKFSIQYWTSRGIAVLDVNYGGSSGYGRAYRSRLDGKWGIVDVDDCVNGARFLAARGDVDGLRMAIRGGSAGGYTTLCALTFRDTFKAGASHYGISDLEALVKDTHKFESRYLDRLIGPYPERRDIYFQRSPIHFTDRLNCPMILFQGSEDRVVPPNQAERMVEALRAKGLPVAYLPFAGEQHGFRKAENIKRVLEAELYFYSRIFGFELADEIDPVPIENFSL